MKKVKSTKTAKPPLRKRYLKVPVIQPSECMPQFPEKYKKPEPKDDF